MVGLSEELPKFHFSQSCQIQSHDYCSDLRKEISTLEEN